MRKLIFIWSFISSLCIKSIHLQSTFSCGVPQIRKTELIRHGSDTIPGAWPWHVAIFKRERLTSSYICGGTLISEIFVLTAAHCMRSEQNRHQLSYKRIFVRLGMHNLDNIESIQQHTIEKIHRPKSDVGQNLKNDIALLELITDAQFNDFVQPACVSSVSDLTGQFGTVVGWGLTEDDEVSPTLKSAQMPTIDSMTCLKSNRDVFGSTLDEGIFCAGYTNGTSVCNGDSGGGIFFNQDNVWFLGGIVSFSETRSQMNRLCYTRGYAAFTKVYPYLPWISSVTKQQFSTIPQNTSCTTPTKEKGQCVPIHRCRNIYIIVTDSRPPQRKQANYINQATCTLPSVERSICCHPAQVINSLPFYVNKYPQTNLLPKQCGLSVTEELSRGNVAPVYAYPWMAVLQYNSKGSIVDACGGTLINQRYILTAASCIKTRSSHQLVNIRLGEHTKNQEQDCNIYRDSSGAEIERDCADPSVDYPIESFVVHPDYNRPKYSNDIGLIRLTKDVVMQDHIKPVCLPVTAELRNQVLEKFIVTGWGATENSTGSNALLEAVIPRVGNTECQQRMTQNRLNIQLSDKQMCAGGVDQVDTCRGDSGGPLGFNAKYNNQARFIQLGVVSAGVDSCGLQNVPGIYTRVGSYIDWILDSMEP